MYIVLLLDKIFCRHQLSPFDLWCHLGLGFVYWFFLSLWPISIGDRGVLQSPITTVLGHICAFKSFSIVWWNWVCSHWVYIGWWLLFPFDLLPLLLVWSVLLYVIWPIQVWSLVCLI
jgi:hypothetical protein